MGSALEGTTEADLAQGQRHPGGIAQQRDVDLPPGDELLDQGWLVEGPEDFADRLPEAPAVMTDRIEVHPHRGVLSGGLDDQRERQLERFQIREALHRPESGGGDASGEEELLGLVLVERQPEGQRRGAGIGEAEEVEQAGDGHLPPGIPADRLTEVEDQVRRPSAEEGDDGQGVLPHRDHRHAEALALQSCPELARHPLHVRPRLASWVFLQSIGVCVVQERDVHAVTQMM